MTDVPAQLDRGSPSGHAGTRSTAPPVQDRPVAVGRSSSDLPLAIVKSLRPKQWTKNLLVFTGLVFTYNLLNWSMLASVLASFAVFCALSSAGYLWNDIRDVEADRLHPV